MQQTVRLFGHFYSRALGVLENSNKIHQLGMDGILVSARMQRSRVWACSGPLLLLSLLLLHPLLIPLLSILLFSAVLSVSPGSDQCCHNR